MARLSSLTPEQKEKILELYREIPNFKTIAQKVGVPYNRVRTFLKSMEKTSLRVITKDENLAKKDIEQTFDAYTNLIVKIDEIERFLIQMKNEDGTVNLKMAKDYQMAWNAITNTLQWWIDKKIKIQEMMNTQVFRDAILETIKDEFPSVARRIREIIREKQKELGLM